MYFADRKLRFDIKGPDTFNLITKELDTIGKVIREREDIDDSTANGKLSWLINEIYTFEIVFIKELIDEINAELNILRNLQRVLFQVLLVDHLLGDRFRISHHNAR